MKFALQATLSFGLLALCLATSPVRWCTTSAEEQAKCTKLQQQCFGPQQSKDLPAFSCVRKTDPHDCIRAIKDTEADAFSIDGGLIFDASLMPYNLKPVVAEVYASGSGETIASYYAVAVVKKGKVSSLSDLRGKKSCHTGFGKSAGWNGPIGILLLKRLIEWAGAEIEPLEKAVARFFSAACVPGVKNEPDLCRLCKGKCDWNDPYAGYSGALECLLNGGGDVAFVKDATVLALSPEERSKLELLCDDDTKKPIEEYRNCFLARMSAHAVVARSVDGRADEIWALLSYALEQSSKHGQQACQLFGSPQGSPKDLLFKDSAVNLIKIPDLVDAFIYLGSQYYSAIQNLRRETPIADPTATEKIVLCAVGYVAVAVAKKKDVDITWNTLNGKKSCHTGVDRTAGWIVPMGLICGATNCSCKFDKFFSESCAPGSPPDSSFCKLCKGSGGEGGLSQKYKCKPNSNEIYNGYNGCFRCLLEAGDVAFVKHTTITDNTEGQNKPAWAGSYTPNDFVLLNVNGERCQYNEHERCGLANVPTHGVVTRPEIASRVRNVLLKQQIKFGSHGTDKDAFQMFHSDAKDSLFKDGTACLATPKEKTYQEYLGEQYMNSLEGFKKCLTSELLKACNFITDNL
uniref:Ovotransferrin-like n=1 Tax=Ailuropoda melanoleuca TaxID=9646 RepID=A0A7N5P090_AILME